MKERIKKLLTEAVLHLTKKDVPADIARWVESRFGGVPSHIQLIQGEIVRIDLPWHEAAREYYQAFEMIGQDRFKPIGSTLSRSGSEGFLDAKRDEEFGIPAGGLVVRYCTYPKQLTIFTGEGALPVLIDSTPAEGLSDNAIVALYTAKTLKSFARPKFDQSVYDELISKGYMMKNKSITADGRNILSAMKDKIGAAIDRYNEEGERTDKYFNKLYFNGWV